MAADSVHKSLAAAAQEPETPATAAGRQLPPGESTRAREHLANERTLLAWSRTSLTLIGLGFVVARFGLFVRELENPGSQTGVHPSLIIGIGLVVAGLVAGSASVVRFFRARRQIDSGAFRAEYWPEVMLIALVAILGVAMTVYLAVNG